ncbi:MAG TPA: hypothetical protein DEA75_01895, partial [Rhodobacteraceae bacterium]|nr:hypothetical protein [Paracoccaceae bacterium]
HSSWRSAPHQGETRLCISLPFHISFIANSARKRPELNRDKTKPHKENNQMSLDILGVQIANGSKNPDDEHTQAANLN